MNDPLPTIFDRAKAAVTDVAEPRPMASVHESARRRTRRRRAALAATVVIAAGVSAPAVLALRGDDRTSIGPAATSIDLGGLRMTGDAAVLFDLTQAPEGWRREIDTDVLSIAACLHVVDGPDGTPTCDRLEGPAGVGQVNWLAPGNTGVTADNPGDSPVKQAISIVTTHTDLDAVTYARQWSVTGKGAAPLVPTTVRDHAAVSYDTNGPETPTVTWQERPGLVVSVAGNAVDPALVAQVAQTVTELTLESAPVPVVAARPDGISWDAGNNNHPGVVVERRGDHECVGWSYVDTGCTAEGVWVQRGSDGLVVAGVVAAGTLTVEVVTASGDRVPAALVSVPGYATWFFDATLGDARPVRVEMRAADGSVVASRDVTVPPDVTAPRDVTAFCTELRRLSGEHPESYVGSPAHVDDATALAAVAPEAVAAAVERYRDYVASGAIAALPGKLTEDFPADVRQAIADVQAYAAATCPTS